MLLVAHQRPKIEARGLRDPLHCLEGQIHFTPLDSLVAPRIYPCGMSRRFLAHSSRNPSSLDSCANLSLEASEIFCEWEAQAAGESRTLPFVATAL